MWGHGRYIPVLLAVMALPVSAAELTPHKCELQSIDSVAGAAAVTCEQEVMILKANDAFGEYRVEGMAGNWLRLRHRNGDLISWGLGEPGEPNVIEEYLATPDRQR